MKVPRSLLAQVFPGVELDPIGLPLALQEITNASERDTLISGVLRLAEALVVEKEKLAKLKAEPSANPVPRPTGYPFSPDIVAQFLYHNRLPPLGAGVVQAFLIHIDAVKSQPHSGAVLDYLTCLQTIGAAMSIQLQLQLEALAELRRL